VPGNVSKNMQENMPENEVGTGLTCGKFTISSAKARSDETR
jgi:hypothetical protein